MRKLDEPDDEEEKQEETVFDPKFSPFMSEDDYSFYRSLPEESSGLEEPIT